MPPSLPHLENSDGAGVMLSSETGESFSTCNVPWLLFTFISRKCSKIHFSGKWRQPGLGQKKGNFENVRDRTTDTFQNGQPCRVMREPDRIARQAGILPSVIKRHISQLKNFHFLVRGVKASSLENKGSRPNKAQEGNGTMSKEFWKRSVLLSPTPSAQKVKHQKFLQRTLSEEPFSIC